jgi:hypothetical protein
MFSDEFHEPGTKKEVREKDPPHRSFIRAALSARTHWKISEMCYWHLPLADIFTSICLAPCLGK